jgi:hypothetical protein
VLDGSVSTDKIAEAATANPVLQVLRVFHPPEEVSAGQTHLFDRFARY